MSEPPEPAVVAEEPSLPVKPRKSYTEVFIINESTAEILLGLKKRGAFTGLYHGFGGKVESGESIAEAAQREMEEECGLIASLDQLQYRGQIDCEMLTHVFEIHMFTCTEYEGEICESDEMAPAWFDLTSIPYDKMWPDTQYWFPCLLDWSKPMVQLCGTVLYGGDDEKDLKSINIWEATRSDRRASDVDGTLIQVNPSLQLVNLEF